MVDIPTLTTERLILRGYRPTDFDAYAAMWAEPLVIRYVGGSIVSREDSWTRFLRQFGMWEAMGFGFFAVIERSSGVFVGEVGFQERRRELQPPIEGSIETGWGFMPFGQGRGLALEAVQAALHWADATLPAPRYTALIDERNAPSMRLAGKLGFREFAQVLYHGWKRGSSSAEKARAGFSAVPRPRGSTSSP